MLAENPSKESIAIQHPGALAVRPRVSVVIPAFNAERFIGRALKSALGQTYSNLEIVVVDDNSADRTPEVAAGIDPRIRIIRRKTTSGAAMARNAGIEAADGEYVAFLDADDEWLPEKL